jgi:hypothetical protein
MVFGPRNSSIWPLALWRNRSVAPDPVLRFDWFSFHAPREFWARRLGNANQRANPDQQGAKNGAQDGMFSHVRIYLAQGRKPLCQERKS